MPSHLFDAVIFDLDGVITKTALVHSAAWKKMFDEYLLFREKKYGEKFIAFTHEHDYLTFVDGKPRYNGVKSFLESRGIEIPFGDPADDPSLETVCGLGNRKNRAFNEVLLKDGVEVYESTVSLIKLLKENGIRVGVASSSKNCTAVLEKAGLSYLIETIVDGVVSAEKNLKGKPEPDIFTTAANNLGVDYDRSVVIEDAVSGVQAGKKGNFGLIIGIARENNERELKINGADVVVKDLADFGFDDIRRWFRLSLENDSWQISYYDYDPAKEKTRESLLTTGNGYFGVRGSMEENHAGEFNYPGTYIAGLYNRLISKVGDREVSNEDFVNCPNWTHFTFRIGDGEWFDLNKAKIIELERTLNISTGLYSRKVRVQDDQGRITLVESERFASMDNPHIAGICYRIFPVNYSARITVRCGINGNIINNGVERYRDLNQKHLVPVDEGCRNNGHGYVSVKTTRSGIIVSKAARHKILYNGKPAEPLLLIDRQPGELYSRFSMEMDSCKTLTIEKTVSIFTSQPWDSADPEADATALLFNLPDYRLLLRESSAQWDEIWKKADIKITGDRLAQKLLRLHLYHLMVSFSPHNVLFDASITARGLHGEAYRGHIFWDELFILPLYNLHFPEAAKAALLYRYRRLDKAREYARQHGYAGAMFPWQSGSDGREETQVVHLNPVTGHWGPDHSSLQRHVSLAIAFNIWNYFHVTGDKDFMEKYGCEIFLEICRFWDSKAVFNKTDERYDIAGVMGPDEFHEKYPHAKEGGLKNNTYTNIMAAWAFGKASELLEMMSPAACEENKNRIGLKDGEIKRWKDISQNLRISIQDGILAQYEGYFDLKEPDWNYFRTKYGNIYRMDRLLKAEGLSADDFKVAKQADALMAFYHLDEQTVTGILQQMGYRLPDDYLQKNLEYYLQRTSHGSTLSRVVHAHLANMTGDTKLSWDLYLDALTSDYNDIQGGTTGEGIHAGVMAGTILVALFSFAGLNPGLEIPRFDPKLPEHWRAIQFRFGFRGVKYFIDLTRENISIRQENPENKSVEVEVKGKKYNIKTGKGEIITL
ncbi:MAG: beta-phosphoglucomutase family hydrolase [Bacteroidales bacterium]|nr:beta-phosphoglucomutase family hydrolase [Bacteroidales bacterium]